MSVSALDHLLLSVAGRPSPRTRESRPAHELLVPFRQRFLFQGHNSVKHTRKRQHSNAAQKRQHAVVQKPQPALSLRFYGLKKNAWLRSLLSVLRVDVDRLDTSQSFSGSRLALVSSDSKVRLFFDGLETRAWRRPSPLALSGKGRSVLQVAVESFPRRSAMFHPNVGISVDREIEKVRSRRKSVRRMSVMGRRPRRTSCYRARDDAAHNDAEDASNHACHEDNVQLDRIEAAIDAATADAVRVVAAHANAQLSFELMERKAHEDDLHINGVIDNDADSQPSWTESAETDDPLVTAGDELETLRAENAQQKALIQQLLMENRQLRTQQHHSLWVHGPDADLPIAKQKRTSGSRLPQQQERDRGPSSVSTDSSLSSLSRRNSFAVDAVDETPVDHAFDLLVAEITLELDELLSEGKWPPVRRRTRVSVDSSTVEAIGGLVRCV